jgi:hypothetical protein
MNKMSEKNKIAVLLIVWLALCGAMLGYFFKILDAKNQQTLSAMAQDRQNLAVLQALDQSFKKAQSDLQKIDQEPIQPGDFFSRDITLVKEIETVQALEQKYGVKMELSGVAGTISSLSPAPTASQIAVVPYNISLSGSLAQVMDYVEALENVSFVTNINGLFLSAGGQGTVNAGLSANFYLLKQ